MAGYVLARFRRFRGRLVFTGMVSAPLVMPEVITGLSMLLLFVSMEQLIGWPAGRGKLTIILAHTTFCLTYVAVILQARLSQLDQSLEEAALDLGCRPLKTFFVITLPIIAPAIVSGWLLGLHPLPRRCGDLQLHHRPGRHDLAHGGLLAGAPRPQSRDQRARHHHHRRGGARAF